MRQLKHIALLVAISACLAAAGCGSDEEGAPIPADSAAALENQLNGVQGRIDAGPEACADVTGSRDPNTSVVTRLIEDLPEDVDEDVRQALTDGFERLWSLVDDRCEELRSEAEQAEPEPEPVIPEPEPTPTETNTVPTDTNTNTNTTPTETEPEPEPEGEEEGSLPPLDGESLDGGAVAPQGTG